jgi:hypothetical protein
MPLPIQQTDAGRQTVRAELTTEAVPPNFQGENPMPGIPGKLLADLHPNGTVRMVFIAHTGGGNEAPLTAKNLDAAEAKEVTITRFPDTLTIDNQRSTGATDANSTPGQNSSSLSRLPAADALRASS